VKNQEKQKENLIHFFSSVIHDAIKYLKKVEKK